ncbi:MAG: hypothetical protein AB8B72_04070 [Crocinitomicaceae bacterium]
MKVLLTAILLFLVSFPSEAFLYSEFLWQPNTRVLETIVSLDNSTENKTVEFSSATDLEFKAKCAETNDQRNKVFKKLLDRFSCILNLQNDRKKLFSNLDEDLPASNYGFKRLKQIDFSSSLWVSQPIQVNHTKSLMAISEFKVYSNHTSNMITIALDYLSNQEIQVFNSSGKLMSKIIIGDINKAFIDLDISNFPKGIYLASDGESTIEFTKK